MPTGGLLRTLWRRKLLAVAALIATGALAFVTGRYVGPTYSARAVVVLLPPPVPHQVDNPYLYLGGILQARDVVQYSLTSERARTAVQGREPAGAYTVDRDPLSEGPLLVINAEGPTGDAAQGTLRAVLAQVTPTVRSLQTRLDVAAGAQITSSVVTQDSEPTLVLKQQLRAQVGVGVLGLALSALLIGLVDGPLSRARRERRLGRAAARNGGEAGSDTEQPPEAATVAAREPDPLPAEQPAQATPRARQRDRARKSAGSRGREAPETGPPGPVKGRPPADRTRGGGASVAGAAREGAR